MEAKASGLLAGEDAVMEKGYIVKSLDGGMQIFDTKEHAAKYVLFRAEREGIRIWDGKRTEGWSEDRLAAVRRVLEKRLAQWMLSDSDNLNIAGYVIWIK